jgi:hypothetical protein
MATQLFLSQALYALKILNDCIPDSETTQTNSTVNPHPQLSSSENRLKLKSSPNQGNQ